MKTLTLAKAIEKRIRLNKQLKVAEKSLHDLPRFNVRGKMTDCMSCNQLLYNYAMLATMHKELTILFSEDDVEPQFIIDTMGIPDTDTVSNILDSMLQRIRCYHVVEKLEDHVCHISEYIGTFSKDELKRIRNVEKLQELDDLGII